MTRKEIIIENTYSLLNSWVYIRCYDDYPEIVYSLYINNESIDWIKHFLNKYSLL